jgi:hypothetical protein
LEFRPGAAAHADPRLLAAIALSAAAQRHEDPFADSLVQDLTAAARGSHAIAVIAALLWMEADTYREWAPGVTRPPGLPRIWQTILALPPENPHVLLELGGSGAFTGHAADAGLLLLRIFVQRLGTTADDKAQAASVLARRYDLHEDAQRLLDSGGAAAKHHDIAFIRAEIAEAALRHGHDEQAARMVLAHALSNLDKGAFYSYMETEVRVALQAGGARQELVQLGDVYMQQAAQAGLSAENRGDWIAAASDCYRRAGQREQAQAAARRGLPGVEAALAKRVCEVDRTACDAGKGPHDLASSANGFGTEPVVALYRAGAVREALDSGFLTGFERFRNASDAGEVRDVQWVVDDHDPTKLDILVHQLAREDNGPMAGALYSSLKQAARAPQRMGYYRESRLAVMAALAGRVEDTRRELVHTAAALDTDAEARDPAVQRWEARGVAADWREALLILSRRARALQGP